jgi:non-heme chloroperoxidase
MDRLNLDRRSLLLGLAGTAAAGALPASARAASTNTTNGATNGAASAASRPARSAETFQVRSSDGLTLAGDAQGDPGAPEILFVHGLRQSRLSWDRQVADPALAGFRMVRFDLRGHGDSDKPESPDAYADLDRWADDIAAVIDGAKLRRPVLAGWSLGGWAIGGYLRRHGGGRIAGLNLVDAVVKFSPDLLTPLAGVYAGTTSSPDLAVRTKATADFLLDCFHQKPTGTELQQMMLINGMTPRAVNTGITRPGSPDLDAAFKSFTGPILVTHGVHDRLVRTAMSEHVIALQPKARLSLYQNSGHAPFYEEAPRFNRELAAFATLANKG